jgi:hypothetical protein
MQVTGMLYGARLLQFVGFPAKMAAAPDLLQTFFRIGSGRA